MCVFVVSSLPCEKVDADAFNDLRAHEGPSIHLIVTARRAHRESLVDGCQYLRRGKSGLRHSFGIVFGAVSRNGMDLDLDIGNSDLWCTLGY